MLTDWPTKRSADPFTIGDYGVLRQSRSFRAATMLGDKGRHRIVRWRVKMLFRKAGRDVALRVIELTGAIALRLWSAATTLGDKGPSPNCSVAREQVV